MTTSRRDLLKLKGLKGNFKQWYLRGFLCNNVHTTYNRRYTAFLSTPENLIRVDHFGSPRVWAMLGVEVHRLSRTGVDCYILTSIYVRTLWKVKLA